MKQPVLFEVAKQGLSRKEKLAAFCKANHIYTHLAGAQWGDYKWSAMFIQPERRHEKPEDIVADSCRILSEAGLLVEGMTEREAVEKLCQNVGIKFDL